ncbi:hypothetical protein H310_05389 [Aphanomyces invadans]|uniref:FYVE-type domain-containing protein n=1 Tax=Aphanomyces invadans TaxID=157072 RepID=A0A024U9L5_9STRA|nr:hypothetical protein H310_05389 [Aphanomyces invadans]ETW02944.1 hypothetical protein H310_05389 [Aphanomyces invadans]|eukprot:XP_008868328.1 hypothetical protein H310_05389 [Aphanomyces invadans]
MRGPKLPLPLDVTPPSADAIAQWKRLAFETKDQLVNLSRLKGGQVQWKKQSEKQRVRVYRGVDAQAPLNSHTWCAVTEIQATIDEVDHALRSDATRTGKVVETAELFDRNVLDAATVYTLDITPASSLGIQWLLTRPMGPLSTPRDWCLLTYTVATTVQGRRGWVRAYTSVDANGCRRSSSNCDDPSSREFLRGHHFCSGYVVMESTTKPGFLHVRLTIQCTFHGKDAASIKALHAKCQHLSALDVKLRSMRLSRAAVRGMKNAPTHASSPRECCRCKKAFGLFTLKAQCHACNQTYCRPCCPQWPIVMANGAVANVRACIDCSLMTSSKPRLSFHASTEVDVVEAEPAETDDAMAAHEAFFKDIKQRCSVVLTDVEPHTRVSKADAGSLWPQPQPGQPNQFQRMSPFQLSPYELPPPVHQGSHSAKTRRSSLHNHRDTRRYSFFDVGSTDASMRPATRSLLEDDDLARQIYQNRQSVLQII